MADLEMGYFTKSLDFAREQCVFPPPEIIKKELKLILYCAFLVSIKQSLTPARTLHLLENQ